MAEPIVPTRDGSSAQRLAGMGQLLMVLRGEIRTDGATLAAGVQLFDDHVHQVTELLELKPSEREGLLRPLPAAGKALPAVVRVAEHKRYEGEKWIARPADGRFDRLLAVLCHEHVEVQVRKRGFVHGADGRIVIHHQHSPARGGTHRVRLRRHLFMGDVRGQIGAEGRPFTGGAAARLGRGCGAKVLRKRERILGIAGGARR